MKPIHFHNDTYYEDFYFCPGFKESDYERAVKEFDSRYNPNISDCDGCIDNPHHGIFIWVRHRGIAGLGSLHHECIHAANECLKQKGVKQDTDNDEALTYLSQWLFEKCVKHMRVKDG